MNFSDLALKFLSYLQETSGQEQTQGQKPTTDANIAKFSVFSHAKEFKEFLKQELNINDCSLVSMSITDIMKMNVEDGKLTESSEYQDGNTPSSAEAESQQADQTAQQADQAQQDGQTQQDAQSAEQAQNQDILNGMLQNLFNDETFKSTVDADKSGDVDEKELNNFLNYIKDFDGNKDDVSIEDLFSTINAINDGTFNMNATPEAETPAASEEPIQELPSEAATGATDASGGVSGASGASGSSGSSGSSGGSSGDSYDSSTPESNDAAQPKSLDNMTKEELNSELNTANSDLDSKKADLSSILDGSNSEIADLKTKSDDAYQAYQAALKEKDPEIAEQLDKIVGDINTKETEISQKEQDISNQKTTIADAKNTYDAASSKVRTLKDSISALESQDTSSMDAEQKSSLASKIADAKAELTAAEEEEAEAKRNVEEQENKLTTLEGELTELKTGANGLEKLKSDKTTLEEKIKTDHPEVAELMKTYNDAKQAMDTKKETLKVEAQSAIDAAQTRVNEVKQAINNLDNNEIKNKYSTTPDLFTNAGYEKMEYKGVDGMNYVVYAPKGADFSKPLPAMVYLHGTGETGSKISDLNSGSLVKMLNNNELNFNGYIIMPQTPNKNWKDKSNKIKNFVNSFSQDHAIDKNNIVIAGHSMGAAGAINMAANNDDHFYSRALLLSGYDPGSSALSRVNIPVWGIDGTKDCTNTTFVNKLKNAKYTKATSKFNGEVPARAFGQYGDEILRWLFPDYAK